MPGTILRAFYVLIHLIILAIYEVGLLFPFLQMKEQEAQRGEGCSVGFESRQCGLKAWALTSGLWSVSPWLTGSSPHPPISCSLFPQGDDCCQIKVLCPGPLSVFTVVSLRYLFLSNPLFEVNLHVNYMQVDFILFCGGAGGNIYIA